MQVRKPGAGAVSLLRTFQFLSPTHYITLYGICTRYSIGSETMFKIRIGSRHENIVTLVIDLVTIEEGKEAKRIFRETSVCSGLFSSCRFKREFQYN